MIYEVKVDESTVQVDVQRAKDGGWDVKIGDGPVRRVTGGLVGPTDWVLQLEGQKKHVGLHVEKEHWDAQVDGHALRGTVIDPRRKALDLTGGAGQGEVRTMMPGAVVRVPVAQGQQVHKGQVLVVVEAMKMENEFKSPIDGVIQAIHVTPGTAVVANALLITVA
jgi:biotin carboxyl carrier protein